MALINCHGCKREISSHAPSCPYCDAVQRQPPERALAPRTGRIEIDAQAVRVVLLAFLSLGLFSIAIAALGFLSTDTSSTRRAVVVEQPQGQSPPGQSTPALAAFTEARPAPEQRAAVPLGWVPDQACNFIGKSFGIAIRPYQNEYEDEYSCSTPYKKLQEGFDQPNNLAYYVTGNRDLATEVKLVLNVNEPSNEAHAIGQLKKFASVVAKAATGADLPPGMSAAITSGTPKTHESPEYRQELKRDNWPNGNGYELHYVVKNVGVSTSTQEDLFVAVPTPQADADKRTECERFPMLSGCLQPALAASVSGNCTKNMRTILQALLISEGMACNSVSFCSAMSAQNIRVTCDGDSYAYRIRDRGDGYFAEFD